MANKKRPKMISISKKYEEQKGVWRTIGGRRVFIKTGQNLSDAMRESGKFKTRMDEKAVKGAREEDLKEQYIQSLNDVSKMEYNGEITRDEYDEAIKNINKTYKERTLSSKKESYEEYELYKRAKENPDSIDPMTENSTDWEALDKKYGSKKEFHYAGEELYSDDPNRFGDAVKKHNEKMFKEQQESAKRVEERYLKDRYKGTYEYLKNTKNMSGTEILELLKKIDEDKK